MNGRPKPGDRVLAPECCSGSSNRKTGRDDHGSVLHLRSLRESSVHSSSVSMAPVVGFLLPASSHLLDPPNPALFLKKTWLVPCPVQPMARFPEEGVSHVAAGPFSSLLFSRLLSFFVNLTTVLRVIQ